VIGTTVVSTDCNDIQREHAIKTLKNRWAEAAVQEILELPDADMEYIETKRALATYLHEQRLKKHRTQTELAARLETGQSRVAKMKANSDNIRSENRIPTSRNSSSARPARYGKMISSRSDHIAPVPASKPSNAPKTLHICRC
jgi:hypothetical protein